MATVGLSEKQRQALMYLEQSRAAGVRFSQHVRAQGEALRPMYDALAAARRKGMDGAGMSAVAKCASAPFVKVRLASAAPPPTRSAIVCRVLLGGAAVIECGEWPPAAWVSALLGSHSDAAP